MKLNAKPELGDKIASLVVIALLLLSTATPIAFAAKPPTIPGNEEYVKKEGVLDTDTYILYPYEEESLTIGFSKYGELIDGDTETGLMYKGTDVFANPAVPMEQWSSGWVMDLHYTDQNYLKNIWAYALFTDMSGTGGIAGDWRQMQQSKDASAPGDQYGGRRTNGWAETDDIRLIYDGPRKAIYLLNTTIYDKDPGSDGTPLVEIIIQLEFNKVKKYVLEIKDIKRLDDNKFTGPFQIEFSQRGQWDIGDESNPESWAEFYNGLKTKYWKHPFYYPGDAPEGTVTYDLCQMIDKDEELVAYAAFWPNLISKWVSNVDTISRLGGMDMPGILETMETESKKAKVPDGSLPYPSGWPNNLTKDGGNNLMIEVMDDLVEYPRGAGEWSDEPWVFKKDATGWKKLVRGIHWEWNTPFVVIDREYWGFEDQFLVLYKEKMMGFEEHTPIPLPCMPVDLFANPVGTSYGMQEEPKTPYLFAEWDFDLDYDHPENSTHQFRCVSLYGLTDNHNAVDPDMKPNPASPAANEFRIDREVVYQLDEVFNPWDLKDAADKEDFRWVQKGPVNDTILLEAHLYDKYGNVRDCLRETHTVWVPEKWGTYCEDADKILLYDMDGDTEPVLLERPGDYVINETANGWMVTFRTSFGSYDAYKVLYSTRVSATPAAREMLHQGRWEWLTVGESSLAPDSIGAAMVTSALGDWKDREVWLTGLDIGSTYGPTIPMVMRLFDPAMTGKEAYQYDPDNGDYRAALKDDWCTPDDWTGSSTIYPYAISSSNIITVGGPIVNLLAEYYNDFTDALIFTEYGDGFYAPGCWARTVQPTLGTLSLRGDSMNTLPKHTLWYDSTDVDDEYGYAVISTYKDLNETVGLIVYGYTAEDTYYACYALRGGLIEWLQHVQDGTTTLIMEIDYNDIHPVEFHIKEFLGPFTECTGLNTNFKTSEYYANLNAANADVAQTAFNRNICYKLVDIELCGQVHPDP